MATLKLWTHNTGRRLRRALRRLGQELARALERMGQSGGLMTP